MSKIICILLGAGFSRAVANMPALENVSESVRKALNNCKYIDPNFKSRFVKYPLGKDWDYERFAELIANMRMLVNSENNATYFFDTEEKIRCHEKSVYYAEEITYREVLKQLSQPSNKTKYKNLRKDFKEFVVTLVKRGFVVHLFDLNHDLVTDSIFNVLDKDILYENFFVSYKPRGYAIQSKPEDLKTKTLHFLKYEPDLLYSNKANVCHYKLHGSLNITYLRGMPFGEKHLPKHPAVGPHLVLTCKQNNQPDYGTASIRALKTLFKEGVYRDWNSQEHRVDSSIINVGNMKSQILTKDFLQYFPDCYSKFARLGDQKASLLTIGYGFRDSHINHVLQRHFDTEIFTSYQNNHTAKILFSGVEDIPLITKPLNEIKCDGEGIMSNRYGRKIICSGKYFEKFLEVANQ